MIRRILTVPGNWRHRTHQRRSRSHALQSQTRAISGARHKPDTSQKTDLFSDVEYDCANTSCGDIAASNDGEVHDTGLAEGAAASESVIDCW